MSEFPAEITREQMLTVCETLGLPAKQVKELHLDALKGLAVTLYVHSHDGRKLQVGSNAMTHRVHIPIRGEEGVPGAPA